MVSEIPTLRDTPMPSFACDDETYTFGSYIWDGKLIIRDCSWITFRNFIKRREQWCNETVNGRVVSEACPMSCGGTCPPTLAPNTSLMPSSAPSTRSPSTYPTSFPTDQPSPFPTDQPTPLPSDQPSRKPSVKPSNQCVDSQLRIAFIKDGVRIARYCEWVANKDTNNRCKLVGVAAACPVTCFTCTSCIDPESGLTGLKFKFIKNGSFVSRNCAWVARKDTINRCRDTNDICRETCGVC